MSLTGGAHAPASTDSTVVDHSARPGPFLVHLRSSDGWSYQDFRATLRPSWARIWADLTLTWVALAATVFLVGRLQGVLPWGWSLIVVPFGAIAIGLLLHHLSSFLHEGAHFNLAPTRRASDVVTNVAAAPVVLVDVRTYRIGHLAHHRLLGTAADPERSYFARPDTRFVLRSMLGASALEVLRNRETAAARVQTRRLAVPVSGAVVHGSIVLGAAVLGAWWVSLAWFAGTVSFFPVFNALRQNLEHRRTDARSDVDYSVEDHGALTRCFDGTIGGILLGGVGFSRHLIHHWDPSLSYTNLADAERFLRQTAAAPIIDARSSSYASTWRRLRRATP